MIETRSPDPRQWSEALRWLKYADDDIRSAELLVKDPTLVSSAAFHCQQAVEKMAKATLIAFAAQYPKIHDIAELGRLVGAHRVELGSKIEDLSGLTDWYVTSRYPAAEFMPSLQDIMAALDRLKELRSALATLAPKA